MDRLSIPVADDAAKRLTASAERASGDPARYEKALRALPFNEALDMLRLTASRALDEGRIEQTISLLRGCEKRLTASAADSMTPVQAILDLHAAIMQTLATVHREAGEIHEARNAAAAALNLLVQDAKRKDEPFLEILGCLLYDVAAIHAERGEYKQAERALEKSLKIFGRLSKTRPQRYGPAHLMLQSAVTDVYQSRVKQAELLAHHQTASQAYLQMLTQGMADASLKLVDSLRQEALTLGQMGRHREAVQYHTRSLKLLTRVNPDFDLQQLEMSVDLGEALLHHPATRDKGVHLLNTMMQKAARMEAVDIHRRITTILAAVQSRHLDILALWYKVFPR